MTPTRARPRACNCWQKIDRLRAELADERNARHAAEQNAARFHAQLLVERIRKVR